MSLNHAAYVDMLAQLLPPGVAWRSEDGTTMRKLLEAMADELVRVDERADDLIDEADPRTTVELLADWERIAGLPDSCLATVDQTLQERRAALVSKLTARGGQSAQFFIDLAAALGYTITITEFRPFRVGINAVGDALTNDEWIFTWRVNAPDTTENPFRVGRSTVGEPLSTWGNERLECVINRAKPAHTHVQFAYS